MWPEVWPGSWASCLSECLATNTAAWVRLAAPGSSTVKTLIENRGAGTGRGYSFAIDQGRNLLLQLNDGSAYTNYVSDGSVGLAAAGLLLFETIR